MGDLSARSLARSLTSRTLVGNSMFGCLPCLRMRHSFMYGMEWNGMEKEVARCIVHFPLLACLLACYVPLSLSLSFSLPTQLDRRVHVREGR